MLNLGDGGYSTHDESLVLEHKGLMWNPEMVVVGYVLNDPETEPDQPLHAYFRPNAWWQYSHVTRLIAQSENLLEIEWFGGGSYVQYLHAPGRPKWESVVEGFQRIAEMTRKRNIPVLLLIFPRHQPSPWAQYAYRGVHRQVAAEARRNGFQVIDLLEVLSRHDPAELMQSPQDEHPNAVALRLAAETAFPWVKAHLARPLSAASTH